MKRLIIAIILMLQLPLFCLAQDTAAVEIKPPSLEFIQYKNSNGSRSLKASLHYVENKERKALRNAELIFFAGSDQGMELARLKTSLKGETFFVIPKTTQLPVDEAGLITVGVRFEGNDKFESTEDQVSVRDVNFDFTVNAEDSIKTLMFKAYELNAKGEQIPLKEANVILYVQRMFSPLKIGEAALDSTGSCMIEFPVGLPGDTAGNLRVMARIEENETYGNIQADTLLKWGVPTLHRVPEAAASAMTPIPAPMKTNSRREDFRSSISSSFIVIAFS